MRLRTLTYTAIILAIVAIIMAATALLPTREEAPAAPMTETRIVVVHYPDEPQEIVEEAYFPITDEDRAIVERVVTAEAIGEPFEGQKAVAQCIFETALATGKTPGEVATEPGQYATPAKPEAVTESVREAVSAIFDDGDLVTDEPIRFFYAPARCESKWHESLRFVTEIGGHRFFAEVGTV